MFLKVQLPWNVLIPSETLAAKGLMLQQAIVARLLDEFACKKATEDLGYFMAVTTLESIGEGKARQHTGEVLLPVVFSGITFKLSQEGFCRELCKVLKHGVLLKCGPIQNIFVSPRIMPDYHYVPGENAIFMNDKG